MLKFKKGSIFIVISLIILSIIGYFNYGVTTTVSISGEGSTKVCSPKTPIYVQVTNFTFNKVKLVNFSLELF